MLPVSTCQVEQWQPYFAYQSRRMQSELEQYWNPIELYRFILSPSATLRPIVDAADLMQHLMFQELPYRTGLSDSEGVYYENSTTVNKKGDLKSLAKAKPHCPKKQ